MSSNASRDVQINFSIPITITEGQPVVGDGKSECRPPPGDDCGGPWSGTGGADLAKEALTRTGALLDTLQKAQREGFLSPSGLCELESLQRFYLALKRQVDGPGK